MTENERQVVTFEIECRPPTRGVPPAIVLRWILKRLKRLYGYTAVRYSIDGDQPDSAGPATQDRRGGLQATPTRTE